jgi:predicted nucleotidyltransferase
LRKPLRLPRAVEDRIEELADRLRRAIGDVEVYLFGSYARGEWLEDSDIDLIVVSKSFEGENIVERIGRLRRIVPEDLPVEILAYTPAELKLALQRSVTVQDAATYWRRIC